MSPSSLLSGGEREKSGAAVFPGRPCSRVSRASSYGLWSVKPVTKMMLPNVTSFEDFLSFSEAESKTQQRREQS